MYNFALIGHNIGYSKSKEFFESRGYNYDVFDVENFEQTVKILVDSGVYKGFNVTTPYKQKIIKLLKGPVCERSINTVIINSDGTLEGISTDGAAFYNTFWKNAKPFVKKNKMIKRAAILGYGGVVPSLLDRIALINEVSGYGSGKYGTKIKNIDIFNRTEKNVERHFSFKERKTLPLDAFVPRNYDLIINTIPFKAGIDIHFGTITDPFMFYDLNYADDTLVNKAKGNRFCEVAVNGLEMLYEQAEMSLNYWLYHDKIKEQQNDDKR